MGNCLVTKLKGVVDNANLLKIDEALFEVKELVSRMLYGTSGTITATIVSGNNTFLDGSMSKVITPSTTDNDITLTNSSVLTKIKINSKYDLGYFFINNGYVNFDDFKYSEIQNFVCSGSTTVDGSVSVKNIKKSLELHSGPTLAKEHTIAEIVGEGNSSLSSIYFQNIANIRHIANELNEFAKCSNLQGLTYIGSDVQQLQGSLESFVAAYRALGKTTGGINCWFGINGAATFNGGTAATANPALLQWTETTITWNGVTINA